MAVGLCSSVKAKYPAKVRSTCAVTAVFLDNTGKESDQFGKFDISYFPFREAGDMTFAAFNNAEEISIQNHNLKEAHWQWFRRDMPKLHTVSMAGNEFEDIRTTYVWEAARHHSLKYVDLANNKMTHLPANSFEALDELRTLDLSGNRIATIELGAFKDTSKIHTLDLSGNNIFFYEQLFALDDLHNLKNLDLSNNPITSPECPDTYSPAPVIVAHKFEINICLPQKPTPAPPSAAPTPLAALCDQAFQCPQLSRQDLKECGFSPRVNMSDQSNCTASVIEVNISLTWSDWDVDVFNPDTFEESTFRELVVESLVHRNSLHFRKEDVQIVQKSVSNFHGMRKGEGLVRPKVAPNASTFTKRDTEKKAAELENGMAMRLPHYLPGFSEKKEAVFECSTFFNPLSKFCEQTDVDKFQTMVEERGGMYNPFTGEKRLSAEESCRCCNETDIERTEQWIWDYYWDETEGMYMSQTMTMYPELANKEILNWLPWNLPDFEPHRLFDGFVHAEYPPNNFPVGVAGPIFFSREESAPNVSRCFHPNITTGNITYPSMKQNYTQLYVQQLGQVKLLAAFNSYRFSHDKSTLKIYPADEHFAEETFALQLKNPDDYVPPGLAAVLKLRGERRAYHRQWKLQDAVDEFRSDGNKTKLYDWYLEDGNETVVGDGFSGGPGWRRNIQDSAIEEAALADLQLAKNMTSNWTASMKEAREPVCQNVTEQLKLTIELDAVHAAGGSALRGVLNPGVCKAGTENMGQQCGFDVHCAPSYTQADDCVKDEEPPEIDWVKVMGCEVVEWPAELPLPEVPEMPVPLSRFWAETDGFNFFNYELQRAWEMVREPRESILKSPIAYNHTYIDGDPSDDPSAPFTCADPSEMQPCSVHDVRSKTEHLGTGWGNPDMRPQAGNDLNVNLQIDNGNGWLGNHLHTQVGGGPGPAGHYDLSGGGPTHGEYVRLHEDDRIARIKETHARYERVHPQYNGADDNNRFMGNPYHESGGTNGGRQGFNALRRGMDEFPIGAGADSFCKMSEANPFFCSHDNMNNYAGLPLTQETVASEPNPHYRPNVATEEWGRRRVWCSTPANSAREKGSTNQGVERPNTEMGRAPMCDDGSLACCCAADGNCLDGTDDWCCGRANRYVNGESTYFNRSGAIPLPTILSLDGSDPLAGEFGKLLATLTYRGRLNSPTMQLRTNPEDWVPNATNRNCGIDGRGRGIAWSDDCYSPEHTVEADYLGDGEYKLPLTRFLKDYYEGGTKAPGPWLIAPRASGFFPMGLWTWVTKSYSPSLHGTYGALQCSGPSSNESLTWKGQRELLQRAVHSTVPHDPEQEHGDDDDPDAGTHPYHEGEPRPSLNYWDSPMQVMMRSNPYTAVSEVLIDLYGGTDIIAGINSCVQRPDPVIRDVYTEDCESSPFYPYRSSSMQVAVENKESFYELWGMYNITNDIPEASGVAAIETLQRSQDFTYLKCLHPPSPRCDLPKVPDHHFWREKRTFPNLQDNFEGKEGAEEEIARNGPYSVMCYHDLDAMCSRTVTGLVPGSLHVIHSLGGMCTAEELPPIDPMPATGRRPAGEAWLKKGNYSGRNNDMEEDGSIKYMNSATTLELTMRVGMQNETAWPLAMELDAIIDSGELHAKLSTWLQDHGMKRKWYFQTGSVVHKPLEPFVTHTVRLLEPPPVPAPASAALLAEADGTAGGDNGFGGGSGSAIAAVPSPPRNVRMTFPEGWMQSPGQAGRLRWDPPTLAGNSAVRYYIVEAFAHCIETQEWNSDSHKTLRDRNRGNDESTDKWRLHDHKFFGRDYDLCICADGCNGASDLFGIWTPRLRDKIYMGSYQADSPAAPFRHFTDRSHESDWLQEEEGHAGAAALRRRLNEKQARRLHRAPTPAPPGETALASEQVGYGLFPTSWHTGFGWHGSESHDPIEHHDRHPNPEQAAAEDTMDALVAPPGHVFSLNKNIRYAFAVYAVNEMGVSKPIWIDEVEDWPDTPFPVWWLTLGLILSLGGCIYAMVYQIRRRHRLAIRAIKINVEPSLKHLDISTMAGPWMSSLGDDNYFRLEVIKKMERLQVQLDKLHDGRWKISRIMRASPLGVLLDVRDELEYSRNIIGPGNLWGWAKSCFGEVHGPWDGAYDMSQTMKVVFPVGTSSFDQQRIAELTDLATRHQSVSDDARRDADLSLLRAGDWAFTPSKGYLLQMLDPLRVNLGTVRDMIDTGGRIGNRHWLPHMPEWGPLPEAVVVEVGMRVLRGLMRLHKAGLAHREIRPEIIVRYVATDDELRLEREGLLVGNTRFKRKLRRVVCGVYGPFGVAQAEGGKWAALAKAGPDMTPQRKKRLELQQRVLQMKKARVREERKRRWKNCCRAIICMPPVSAKVEVEDEEALRRKEMRRQAAIEDAKQQAILANRRYRGKDDQAQQLATNVDHVRGKRNSNEGAVDLVTGETWESKRLRKEKAGNKKKQAKIDKKNAKVHAKFMQKAEVAVENARDVANNAARQVDLLVSTAALAVEQAVQEAKKAKAAAQEEAGEPSSESDTADAEATENMAADADEGAAKAVGVFAGAGKGAAAKLKLKLAAKKAGQGALVSKALTESVPSSFVQTSHGIRRASQFERAASVAMVSADTGEDGKGDADKPVEDGGFGDGVARKWVKGEGWTVIETESRKKKQGGKSDDEGGVKLKRNHVFRLVDFGMGAPAASPAMVRMMHLKRMKAIEEEAAVKRAVKLAGQEAAKKIETTPASGCPQGHVLDSIHAPCDGACNICTSTILANQQVEQCETCDWWRCSSCSGSGKTVDKRMSMAFLGLDIPEVEEHAPAPATAPAVVPEVLIAPEPAASPKPDLLEEQEEHTGAETKVAAEKAEKDAKSKEDKLNAKAKTKEDNQAAADAAKKAALDTKAKAKEGKQAALDTKAKAKEEALNAKAKAKQDKLDAKAKAKQGKKSKAAAPVAAAAAAVAVEEQTDTLTETPVPAVQATGPAAEQPFVDPYANAYDTEGADDVAAVNNPTLEPSREEQTAAKLVTPLATDAKEGEPTAGEEGDVLLSPPVLPAALPPDPQVDALARSMWAEGAEWYWSPERHVNPQEFPMVPNAGGGYEEYSSMRDDLWAVGVLMHEMATGEKPPAWRQLSKRELRQQQEEMGEGAVQELQVVKTEKEHEDEHAHHKKEKKKHKKPWDKTSAKKAGLAAAKQSDANDTRSALERALEREQTFVSVGGRICKNPAADVSLSAKPWAPISEPLAAIVNAALNPQLSGRFQTAEEMLVALRNTKKGRRAFFRAHAKLQLKTAMGALAGGEGAAEGGIMALMKAARAADVAKKNSLSTDLGIRGVVALTKPGDDAGGDAASTDVAEVIVKPEEPTPMEEASVVGGDPFAGDDDENDLEDDLLTNWGFGGHEMKHPLDESTVDAAPEIDGAAEADDAKWVDVEEGWHGEDEEGDKKLADEGFWESNNQPGASKSSTKSTVYAKPKPSNFKKGAPPAPDPVPRPADFKSGPAPPAPPPPLPGATPSTRI
jgi:serine/threonine protein kinase